MRFLSIYKTTERTAPPTQEEMAAMGEFIEAMFAEGVLLATEGCRPSALGARVRRHGERVTVVDGPFTESKELVAGFAILRADSREHAIELTRRFLAVAGDGECEVRELHEMSAGAADASVCAPAAVPAQEA